MSKTQKIDEKDLMNFEDFSKLSKSEKEKVKGRSRIIAIERLKNNEDYQKGLEIRNDLINFAKEEIIPLIKEDISDKQAEEKAFFIALKLFMVHDVRLQSAMTLEAISAILGVTRERIRQIESSATKKLKHPKYIREFYEYLNIGMGAETVGF